MLKERPESIIRNTSANLQQDFNRLSKSQTNVANTTVSNIEPVLILMETATSCNSHEKLPDLSQTEKHFINSTSSFINSIAEKQVPVHSMKVWPVQKIFRVEHV